MHFEGIIPAVTTPFDAAGAVDAAALGRNVAAYLDAGIHGIVVNGTMGEAGSLSAQERETVVATVAGVVGGRVPLVAGVSAGTPSAAIDFAADAERAGATALMMLPPLGYRGDAREIAAHYAAVAASTALPLMAYNNPEASGIDMPPALIASLASEVDGLVAVKECSGDVRRIPAILAAAPGLEVLVGGDDWALEGLCAGATGWVTGVADVAPAECVELWERCRAADLEPARALYARLLPLARFDMTPKLVQYFKAAMDEAGLAGGAVRPPRLPLTDAEREDLAAAMRALRGAPVGA